MPARLLAGILSMSAHAASDWQASIHLTAKDTDARLKLAGTLTSAAPATANCSIFIDDAVHFQTLLGIGGAVTDAAAETLAKLPPAKQRELMTAYFDPKAGIGYSLIRTTIHSCDFSSASYTYTNDNDTSLASFNIAPDLKFRIPMIKQAQALAGRDLTIYASPWSPPAWMKTNASMLKGGSLKPESAPVWAEYFVKFIQAYEKQGISIWGVTVQNEPAASQTWESCIYSGEQERDFIKDHLGPAMVNAGMMDVDRNAGSGGKKIIIWDHNRDLMYDRARAVLEDSAAAKYVWGVGFHWYVGDHFENVRLVKERFPETHLLFTEGCVERFDASKINEWKWGETYGRSIINDLNNGADGWTDWNILLDERGGPNHVGNFCFAPVHANTQPGNQPGSKSGELTFMNSFYYLGHFSKFIRPRARRIIASSTSDDLLTTAFENIDGTIAVVVMNPTDKPLEVNLCLRGRSVKAAALAHSIITAVITPEK